MSVAVIAGLASTARAEDTARDATSGTSSTSATIDLSGKSGSDAADDASSEYRWLSDSGSSGSGSEIRAFVPRKLLDAAVANPTSKFSVIVQGERGKSSHDVETEVDATADGTSGTSEGSKHAFRTLAAVSAQLTGEELVKLAHGDDILAITRDEKVVTTAVALPTVSGNERAGAILKAETAGWPEGGASSYTYQWQRCDPSGVRCADIGGATGDTYKAGSVDIGSTLRVALSAVGPDGTTAAATSPTTGLIAPVTVTGFWNRQQWPYATGLDRLWRDVATAAADPPTIAIVDSGVNGSTPGLDGFVTRVEITSRTPNAPGDGRGHGTFVAGIAAGRDSGYAGAAPKSKFVSLDVMDDYGVATTSDVIAAADWIYANKDAYGIRVANFSLVGSTVSTFRYDPLDKAVEKLWLSGVVVVAAAGNYAVDGARSDVRFSPGNDPFVITVGATDLHGTVATGDDTAAPWSAYGWTPDGFAKPEISAPGRYMIASVPAGSTLVTSRADALVEPTRMQLSGTSFAAPVVAGTAANLLALHPEWTPDQVKGALMLSAAALPAATPRSAGVGELDAAAAAAVQAPPDANRALKQFLIADPQGGPTQVFDADAWQTAVQNSVASGTEMWGAEMWGAEMWGAAAWSAEMWGGNYFSSEMWGAEMWGAGATGAEMWGAEMWGADGDHAAADAPVDPAAATSLMSPADWDTYAPVPPDMDQTSAPAPDPAPAPADTTTTAPTDTTTAPADTTTAPADTTTAPTDTTTTPPPDTSTAPPPDTSTTPPPDATPPPDPAPPPP